MGLKYNAFISYRHSEADSKIASEVQTRLERFRIPQAIVKKTGVKRIERIFRDKEELPITSDLNEDIDMALANSDKLIVICSTRTGESIWVRKEIETFLKYHDKKDVFTVLVDGEPEEVIPDILMHDTVTTVLPGGGIETKEEFIEPLSCDYRMDIKRARRVELPRLAAAIIGCSYDELVQRRRQYIRRRNTIIGTCAAVSIAAIIGYLTWSLLQIRMNYDRAEANYALAQSNLALAEENYAQAQENYMDSLRNQSAYLASESGELLADGDRLGAVQLALAALPSEGKDRPVTPEAEYALATALGVYVTPGLSSSLPVWSYGSGYDIKKYLVDQTNLRVALFDATGTINIWSLRDHALLASFKSDTSKISDFVIDSDGRIAIAYNNKIRVIDSNLDDELWSMDFEEDLASSIGYNSVLISNDGSELLYYVNGSFAILDINTGSITDSYNIDDIFENTESSFLGLKIYRITFSSDDNLIAVVYGYGNDKESISVLNRESGEWIGIGGQFGYIIDFEFVPDSWKFVLSYEDDISNSSYSLAGLQVLAETERIIECYDAVSGKQSWSNSIPHTLIGYDSDLMFTECDGEEAVIVLFSNRCTIIGVDSGKIISTRELISEYIDAYLNDKGDRLNFTLRNGMYANLRLDDPEAKMNGYQNFNDCVNDSLTFYDDNGTRYFLIEYDGNNYLKEYSTFYYDRSYTPVGGLESSNIYASYVAGKHLLALDTEMNLYCTDMGSGKIVWTTKIEGQFYTSVAFIGQDEFGNVIIDNGNNISGGYGDEIFKVNVSNGELTKLFTVPDISAKYTDYSGGYLYASYPGGYDEDPYILKYNPSTDEAERIDLKFEGEDTFYSCELYASPDGKHVLLYHSGFGWETTYLANLENGALLEMDILGGTFASWSPDSEWFAISNGESVAIYESDGPRVALLNDFETAVVDVFACEQGLVVLMDNGFACLYDKEGNLISSIDAFRGNLTSLRGSYMDASFVVSDNLLIVSYGGISSVIDMDEFKIRVVIAGFLGYDVESGKIYAKMFANVGNAGSFGYFKVRTIDELIAEGVQYVGDATMSTDMKKRYGIEDD